MKPRRVWLALFAAAWLIVGCGSQPPPTPTGTATFIHPTDTPEPSKVLPTLTPSETRPAWLPVPPENPTIIRITDNTNWRNNMPVWSPDGNQILFRTNRECVKRYDDSDDEWGMKSRCWEWDLYLMDADGSNEIRLTGVQFRDLQSDAWLRWSPDGKRIAFTYSNDFYLPFERVVSFSLEQAKQAPLGLEDMEVLVDEGEDYQVGSFEWSPDGKKYAYDYYQYWADTLDLWDIVVVDVDSGEEVFRTTSTGETLCKFGAWAPNGEAILVSCFRDTVDWEYHIDWVDLNTGDQRLLIANAHEPVWSPDGKWILYFFDKKEQSRNELFNIERGEVVHFPYHGVLWKDRSWSPDGKWIAFSEIEYTVNLMWHNIYLLDMSWLEMDWD